MAFAGFNEDLLLSDGPRGTFSTDAVHRAARLLIGGVQSRACQGGSDGGDAGTKPLQAGSDYQRQGSAVAIALPNLMREQRCLKTANVLNNSNVRRALQRQKGPNAVIES